MTILAIHPADQQLALAWAPARMREPLRVLFALDDHLAELAMRGGEPQLAAIRLAWWRDQLADLTQHAQPSDPLLQAVQRVLPDLAEPLRLADIAEGWGVVAAASNDCSDEDWGAHARLRGGGFFAALGGEASASAGASWIAFMMPGLEPKADERPSNMPRPLRVLLALARDAAARRKNHQSGAGAFTRMRIALVAALMQKL